MKRKFRSLLLAVALLFSLLPAMPQKAEAAPWATIAAGKYYIQNEATQKFLNVCDAGNWNNCNVDTWYFNGCGAQVWTISGNSNSHKVQPGCSSTRVLNQWGDYVVSGHNVCLWDNTNDPSQRWVFQEVAPGEYVIRCAGNTNCVLDVNNSGNVYVNSYNGSASQKWLLSQAEYQLPSGYYRIKNISNGKYLDASGAGDYNNCDVITWTGNNSNAQKWNISGNANFLKIKPKCTVSRVLNQWGDNVVAGHNVCLWDNTNHASQRWTLEFLGVWGGDAGPAPVFRIHCVGNPACVLDVNSSGSVYVDTLTPNYMIDKTQCWIIEPIN